MNSRSTLYLHPWLFRSIQNNRVKVYAIYAIAAAICRIACAGYSNSYSNSYSICYPTTNSLRIPNDCSVFLSSFSTANSTRSVVLRKIYPLILFFLFLWQHLILCQYLNPRYVFWDSCVFSSITRIKILLSEMSPSLHCISGSKHFRQEQKNYSCHLLKIPESF